MDKERKSWWKGRKGEWYVVIQIGLFALLFLGPKTLPGLPAWPEPWLTIGRVLGLLLGLAGGLLILAGVFNLGQNLTAVPYPKENATLVQSGAYRIVRHPIYSGIILGAFGWGFLNAAFLTLLYALLLFIFFDIKSRREEKWLCEKYPDYDAYQKRVHKLIPFIY